MAHILYLEWNSYADKYISRAWKKNNDTVVNYKIDTRDNTRFGKELTKSIVMTVINGKFDYIFSFNYFPVAAMAAKACRVPYVSYIYDSPYALLYSNTVRLDTNHIFLFDKKEV